MPAGRPPMYDTPEQMQEVIDAYFERCKTEKLFPTMSGLAYELRFTTQALRDYEKKDEFLCTVKRAKQFVEMAWEQALLSGKGSGPIFWLKNNAGWKDKTEQERSGPEGGPQEHKWTIEFVEANHDK